MNTAKIETPGLGAMTRDGERGSVRFERRLSTSVEDAWAAVSDPERIARWFAPVTVEGKEWITYWDDGREYAKGQIKRCEPQRLIEVSWKATDDSMALADTVLRVSLEKDDDAVVLRLEHEQLMAKDLVLYGPGWHTYLDRLPDGDSSFDWGERFSSLQPIYQELFDTL